MERSEETEFSKTCQNSYQNEEEEEEDSELKDEALKLKDGGSSSNSTVEESEKKSCVRPYVRSKMPRLRWTNDLHLRFVQAVERLGGQDRATPKLVLELMNIKGLHIAHVKSHLQMYRSKKTDDPNQVVADPRSLVEGGDRNIYNLSQLPMLQCYNQKQNSTFRYDDAPLYGRDWMHNALRGHCLFDKTRSRLYNTAAERSMARNYVGQTNQDIQIRHPPPNELISCRSQEIRDSFGSRIHEKMELWLGQYPNLPNRTFKPNPFNEIKAKVHEHRSIPLDLECTSLEKQQVTKRKASDANLDLNLSLGLNPRNVESWGGLEEDENEEKGEEGNLSLSLYSPSFSRNRKRLITEDDHNTQKARRASTLDLTI